MPYEIIIDDYFPCNASTRQLLFSQPNGPELWGILLEKAWAKLFGNYLVSETMSVSESMQQILGCPSEYYQIAQKDPQEFKKILQLYDDKKYVVNATSFPEGNKEMGIVGMHAYSIISAYSFDDLFLLKLRNPWGNFEWKNGLYSDDSKNWTEDLIKKVDFKNEDDGIFFMTYEEFAQQFRFVSVAFYYDDYQLITMPVTTHKENKPFCWELTIEKEQEVGLRVHQLYERYFNEADHEYESTEVFLFDEDYKFLEVGTVSGCAFGSHAVPFAEKAMIKLKPGKYYLTTKVKFRDTSKPNTYTLSAYAQKDAQLKEITTPNFYSELLQKAIIATYRNSEEAWELLWNCYSYQKFVGRSLLAIYLINKNEKPLKINFTFDEMQNIYIPDEWKETDTFFSVTLKPQEERGIYMRAHDYVGARNYSWKSIILNYI
eukprot:TRINITY_DN676_c0_g1_i1.p1 TRINITY_DN676_c0_g1~~TRINITY_DN676_c0_g1_i1.p1  ORF type:complete len:431 (-),score=74.75 TRINITY_DN676_c0_g1_i1:94-1386(-)